MLVISTFRITASDFRYGRRAFSAATPTVQLMFVSSTYRITGLHYIYGRATLEAAYVGLPLRRESLGYTLSHGSATLNRAYVVYP